MRKNCPFLIATIFLISSCTINADTSSFSPSQISSIAKLNTTNSSKVEIEILNPSNSEKNTVTWYKDNTNSLIMKVNAKAKVIGTVTLKDKTRSSNIKWSSADNTLVVINDDGIIQANKIGNTSIQAISFVDTDYKQTLNVSVVDEANFAPEKITEVKKIETKIIQYDEKSKVIDNNNVVALAGAKIKAIGNVFLKDSTENNNVLWSSSDETIATVNETGNIVIKETATIDSVVTIIAKYRLNPQTKQVIHINIVNDIKKDLVTPILENSSVVSTFAGSTNGFADGVSSDAHFSYPQGVAFDSLGNLFVTDSQNHKIRKITPDGIVTTFAGNGIAGFLDGIGTNTQFNQPLGLAIDNYDNIYVTDSQNHKIRKITPDGVVTTFAGDGTASFLDGIGTKTQFYYPSGIAIDKSNHIYVADTDNQKIRKITPEGVVTTFAGSTKGFADGVARDAQFAFPTGIAVDNLENVYVSDSNNYKIRKITPDELVTTFAGNGTAGFLDGIGTNTQFYYPDGLAVDNSGNVYVADSENHKIRKITPDGVVSTLAGSNSGYLDGSGRVAKFLYPTGITVDRNGNVYVADPVNHRIRKIQ